MQGCAADGTVNQAAFGKPLPAIGLYIAGASVLCAVGMAVDALRGFHSRRPWFPCKYFTLNAVTLTVLAVAVKMPLDFNTPMPRPFDQLAKLSSTVLICTVMGNIIPSIGVTEDAASNIIALAILVVTVAVNVGIQMGTGVVYRYLPEHGAILGIMLVLLGLLISSALPLSTTKRHLEKLYDTKHQKIRDDSQDAGGGDKFDVRNLQEHVKKYWLMAHTSSPQYVLGRSATCTASGAHALLAALTLVEATARTAFAGRSGFCQGSSDYKWSVFLVFLSQFMAVAVGTIGPVCRWFTAVRSRPDSRRESWKEEFKVEEYWVGSLKELMEAPLGIRFTNSRRCRKIIIRAKSMILHAAMRLQTGFVLASKFVLLVSVWPVRWISYGGGLLRKLPSSVPGSSNLQEFVLCLEGEENLVTLITRSERKDTERWIEKGRKNSPESLTSLVESRLLHCAGGAPCFSLVALLDSDEVPSLLPEDQEPSHSWALPVATLAGIAVAVAGEEQYRGSALEQLMTAVEEGIKYVNFVERNLEAKGLLDQRKAVENFWPILSLHHRWYELRLRRVAAGAPSKRKVIELLKASAEARVREYLNDNITNACLEWPPRMLAANCMYRLASTILVLCDKYNGYSSVGVEENMFVWVRALISDLLCACLTNLPAAIYMECFCSRIEVREESVRRAAFLLGECEDIMLLLQNGGAAATYPEEKTYVDDWRACSIADGALQKVICTVLGPLPPSSNATAASLSGITWSSGDQSMRSIDSIEQDQPCPPLDVV